MSTTTKYVLGIKCDGGCQREVFRSSDRPIKEPEYKAEKAALKQAGWHSKLDRDICPACWEVGKR